MVRPRATEDRLLTGIYLEVQPRELAVGATARQCVRESLFDGGALFSLGELQIQMVQAPVR